MNGTRTSTASGRRRRLLFAATATALALALLGPLAAPGTAGFVGMARNSDGRAYWLAASDGGVFTYPTDAPFYGSMGGQHLNAPIVGIASTHTGGGYWLVGSDGGIYSFGDAPFHGSLGGVQLNAPVVGMARTPASGGYWLAASDGGVFAFGTAKYYGSMGGQHLNAPVVGIASTPTGKGYWLLARDGGIFSFGDATYWGSAVGYSSSPFTAIVAHPTGSGYWLVDSGGVVFAYGDAAIQGAPNGWQASAFYGSMGGKIAAMASTPQGYGYWMMGANGNVAASGTAGFHGARIGYGNQRVVYIHGFELNSSSSCDKWDNMDDRFTQWGLTSVDVRVGYYWNDTNCPNSIDNYPTANPYRHYTHSGGSDLPKHAFTGQYGVYGHTNDTQIQHLAYHLAWMLYERYSSKGISVDVVAHSMGGLMIRYALAQTQLGHPDFPPYLLVDDVVTISSPHDGATRWAGESEADEAHQMLKGSNFMDWITQHAPDPQGRDGTEWTLIGAGDDDTVEWNSAVAMGPGTNKVKYYSGQGLEHTTIAQDDSDAWDRDVTYWRASRQAWSTWGYGPHVIGWSYFALCCGGM